MLVAPIPSVEEARLTTLRRLLILDTPPEARFDRIVEFAAAEFDVPIALISLVDRDRQWFKARIGLGACATGRDISFCGHAILGEGIFIVEDALLDERFADNPLVTSDPHIRFYAGFPLQVGGHAIGTLCLIDQTPRQLDGIDLAILASLGTIVVEEIKGEAQ